MSVLRSALLRVAVPERLSLMRDVRSCIGWNSERIAEFQTSRLRSLLQYCWNNVPFYREHWARVIRSPDEIRSIKDLEALPPLTKDHVRSELGALTTRIAANRGEEARSGGSTGRPTVFRMTKTDQEMCWAQMYLGWSWAGYSPGDPFLVVGGESIGVGLGDRRVLRDKIMNRWISSGSNLTVERARELANSPHFSRVRLVYGYPNAIRELGLFLEALGARPRSLRGVVCTAEVMRPEVRQDIARCFGNVPVHDMWGMNDGGLLAAEGPDRDGMHLFFHRGLLEIVSDEGRQIRDVNVVGKALATSLTNLATPFVRYETGDEVHWKSFDPPSRHIRWPTIGPVDGRTGDVIHLPSGRRIAMPGLTLVMRWLEGVDEYQFIQTSESSVTARLALSSVCRLSDEEIVAFLREKIASEIAWTVVRDRPERTRNGKFLLIRNDWMRARGAQRAADALQ